MRNSFSTMISVTSLVEALNEPGQETIFRPVVARLVDIWGTARVLETVGRAVELATEPARPDVHPQGEGNPNFLIPYAIC